MLFVVCALGRADNAEMGCKSWLSDIGRVTAVAVDNSRLATLVEATAGVTTGFNVAVGAFDARRWKDSRLMRLTVAGSGLGRIGVCCDELFVWRL